MTEKLTKKEIQRRADKKRNETLKQKLNNAGWTSLSALKTAIINDVIEVPLHPDKVLGNNEYTGSNEWNDYDVCTAIINGEI